MTAAPLSTIALRALTDAGLIDILHVRGVGDVEAIGRLQTRIEELRGADLLSLGALADAIRVAEVGPIVRIYAGIDSRPDAFTLRRASSTVAGIDFLRSVAIARVLRERSARLRVDWGDIGLELAQVALGFGANELIGPIADKRGLPIADGSAKKVKGQGTVSMQLLKRKELAGLIAIAGRTPMFVDAQDTMQIPVSTQIPEAIQ